MEPNHLRAPRNGAKSLPRTGLIGTIGRWAWSGLKASPLLLALLLAPEREARAYADPGTGALALQMLVAVFIGLLFYFRKFTIWFTARKKNAKD